MTVPNNLAARGGEGPADVVPAGRGPRPGGLGNEGDYARDEQMELLRASRSSRLRLRERLRCIQPKGPKVCGRFALAERLSVVERDGRCFLSGTMRCGRPWTCPWCSCVIGQHRAGEVAEGLRTHLATGGSAFMVSTTVRHARNMSLAEVLGVLCDARSNLVRSHYWRTMVKQLGVVGWVRAMEVTVSRRSGWHPHCHWVLLVDRQLTDVEFARWWIELARRWAATVGALEEAMTPDGSPGVGVDVRRVQDGTADEVGAYLFKDGVAGMAQELSRPEGKEGRGESMTAFQLGEEAADGDWWARDRWEEFVVSTRGRHRLQWSRGLRGRLGLGQALSDGAVVDEVEDAEEVCDLSAEESALVLYFPELAAPVCDAAERGGAAEVQRVLGAALAVMTWVERAELRRWGRDRVGRRRE